MIRLIPLLPIEMVMFMRESNMCNGFGGTKVNQGRLFGLTGRNPISGHPASTCKMMVLSSLSTLTICKTLQRRIQNPIENLLWSIFAGYFRKKAPSQMFHRVLNMSIELAGLTPNFEHSFVSLMSEYLSGCNPRNQLKKYQLLVSGVRDLIAFKQGAGRVAWFATPLKYWFLWRANLEVEDRL